MTDRLPRRPRPDREGPSMILPKEFTLEDRVRAKHRPVTLPKINF